MVVTWEQLEREFGELPRRVRDLSPAMKAGGLLALGDLRERFRRGVDPDGRPWKPLAFARAMGGSVPLRNTGALLASYAAESGPDWFRVGTNHPHARTHHEGATITPRAGRFLTIPKTRAAVYAGSARRMTGLVPLYGPKGGVLKDGRTGEVHWVLTRRVTIPARRQVGLSEPAARRFRVMLVHYLRTGRL